MSADNDTYYTVSGSTHGLFKDKGSRFISFAYNVKSENEAKEIISGLKKKYHDARHVCYAYIIGSDDTCVKFYDDGEPSNTAGKPILNQITMRELSNTLVIVVRYFGGTLLGTPGLVNAYREAASDALQKAVPVKKTLNDIIKIEVPYEEMNIVMNVLKKNEAQINSVCNGTICSINAEVRRTMRNDIISLLEKNSRVVIIN